MRPVIAKAVVKKLKPRIRVLDIYALKDDVVVGKDEKIIRVEIKEIKKKK